MTSLALSDPAEIVADALIGKGLGPYFGTPCGVLAPLLEVLTQAGRLHSVSREENAVGVAVGAALAGRRPVVLMQNSGLGASVNALASLVRPYSIPLALVISMRGVAPDFTSENVAMGRATEPLLDLLEIPYRTLDRNMLAEQVSWVAGTVADQQRAAALLVPPSLFSWRAA